MGFCFSCCRRRSKTGDREPLLPRQGSSSESFPPPQSQIDKAADVLAAFNAGKLPSQDQTNATLRKLLRSDVLAVEGSKSTRILGQGQQYGPLSERGRTVLQDVRELIESIIQFGMEKNDDDRLQDLIYENHRMGNAPVAVDVDVAANPETAGEVENLATAIPPSDELDKDGRLLSGSLLTLSRLLLTSSTFRLLLSDVLLTSRALVADAAADIGRVARTVELKAEAVEQAVRPGDGEDDPFGDNMEESAKQARDELGDVGEETKAEWEKLGEESPDRMKEAIVERLQKVLAQAQQTPAYKSALRTLLYLLHKYVERASTAVSAVSTISTSSVSVTPLVTADPHLARALTDLRILLERLASGRSLAPLLSYLERTLRDVISTSSPTFKGELRRYFEDIGSSLERALAEPDFSTSAQGHRLIERLIERGQELMQSEKNAPWAADARKVLDEVDSFTHALASDRTTCRVIDSFDKLSTHTADLGQTAAGNSIRAQRAWREEFKRDLIGWVLPRALRMLKTVPMPRVELKSDPLEVVIDALVLNAVSASFVPDHVVVQNWSEVRLEASAAIFDHSGGQWQDSSQGGVATSTRTRLHIDGLRISAHRIGYYVRYKGPLGGLISWEDSGLLSIDVGRHDALGEGLAVDIDLETTPTDRDGGEAESESVFRVNDVKVDVPGLRLSIDKSRHWIFNKLLLQPLAGPVIRQQLGNILASQIRAGLESLNERLSSVRKEAKQRVEPTREDGPSVADYWEAMLATMGSPSVDEEPEDEESGPLVETDTHITLKGVVRNTRTQAEPESSAPPTPSETQLAVGVGAQILPGKGGPEPDVKPAADQARDALTELEDAAESTAGKAKAVGDGAVETAVKTREELEEASERLGAREDWERKKKGWRSRVFDF